MFYYHIVMVVMVTCRLEKSCCVYGIFAYPPTPSVVGSDSIAEWHSGHVLSCGGLVLEQDRTVHVLFALGVLDSSQLCCAFHMGQFTLHCSVHAGQRGQPCNYRFVSAHTSVYLCDQLDVDIRSSVNH